MRQVQLKVTRAIAANQVLSTYKTKPRIGRRSVTVGPYRTAVGPRQYAVIIGGEAFLAGTAIEAAQHFIEYVGRNEAWNALHGRGRQR